MSLTISKQKQELSRKWLVTLSAADEQSQQCWYSEMFGTEAEADRKIDELARQHPRAITNPRRYRFGDPI